MHFATIHYDGKATEGQQYRITSQAVVRDLDGSVKPSPYEVTDPAGFPTLDAAIQSARGHQYWPLVAPMPGWNKLPPGHLWAALVEPSRG